MEHAMRSLGVDPSQEYMSDEQFSYAMDEIDRRRVEMDKACNDDQFDHTRFMRDTIRHHLQVGCR